MKEFLRGCKQGWLRVACWVLALQLLVPGFVESEPTIQLRKLATGVWLHTSGYVYPSGTEFPSNGLIVQEGEELTLVDTAWGELATLELLEAIRAVLHLPVRRAVVTHFHGDRAAGVDVLESRGIEVLAHPLTQRFAIEYGMPVPDKTLEALTERGGAVTVGRLQAFFPGPAHTLDNLMVWLPREKILFGGCAVRARQANSAGNTAHGDLKSWLRVLDEVRENYGEAVMVIPGHGEPGGLELLSHTSRLVQKAAR